MHIYELIRKRHHERKHRDKSKNLNHQRKIISTPSINQNTNKSYNNILKEKYETMKDKIGNLTSLYNKYMYFI